MTAVSTAQYVRWVGVNLQRACRCLVRSAAFLSLISSHLTLFHLSRLNRVRCWLVAATANCVVSRARASCQFAVAATNRSALGRDEIRSHSLRDSSCTARLARTSLRRQRCVMSRLAFLAKCSVCHSPVPENPSYITLIHIPYHKPNPTDPTDHHQIIINICNVA